MKHSNEPEIVPDKLKNPIHLRLLVLIAASVTAFHYWANLSGTEIGVFSFFVFSIVSPFVTSAVSFVISYRYRDATKKITQFTHTFQKAYFFLGLAYLFVGTGELLYYVYDEILGIDAYPSFADAAYFVFYPFVIAHLFLNIRFFYPTFNRKNLFWMVPLILGINLSYSALTLSTDSDIIDFVLGHYYVAISSVSLCLTILGFTIFKKSVMGAAWALLLTGIIMFDVADTVYYNLEAFQAYNIIHPVNLLWNIGYWVITYALIKHNKAI